MLTSVFRVLVVSKNQTAQKQDVVKIATCHIASSPTAEHAMIPDHFYRRYAQPPMTNLFYTDPD